MVSSLPKGLSEKRPETLKPREAQAAGRFGSGREVEEETALETWGQPPASGATCFGASGSCSLNQG